VLTQIIVNQEIALKIILEIKLKILLQETVIVQEAEMHQNKM